MHTPVRLICLGLLLTVVGCVTTPRPLRAKAIEQQQVADIPVPRMFSFQTSVSYLYTESFRSAEMVYRGPRWQGSTKVLDFYTSIMPRAAWHFVRSEGPEGRTLIFRKGDEECEVHARPDRDDEATELIIQLRPRA